MVKKLRKKFINWITFERPYYGVPLCDFERIRYELRPCDVLLIEGRSRISEVIRQITQSSWSHACIYIGRIHDVDDLALREKLAAHFPGDPDVQLVIEGYVGRGTIVSALENYAADHIRICRPRGLSRKDAQEVMAFAINKLGTGYDERQLFDLARFLIPWSILPRRWRSSLFEHNAGESTKTICSTMIAEAFAAIDFPILPVVRHHEQTGVELIIRNPRLFTPRDFDYSPYFEIIKYPFVSFAEGPYRSLPWNRQGLYSVDGENIYDPSLRQSAADLQPKKKKKRVKKIRDLVPFNLNSPLVAVDKGIADVATQILPQQGELNLSEGEQNLPESEQKNEQTQHHFAQDENNIDMSLFDLIVLRVSRIFGFRNRAKINDRL